MPVSPKFELIPEEELLGTIMLDINEGDVLWSVGWLEPTQAFQPLRKLRINTSGEDGLRQISDHIAIANQIRSLPTHDEERPVGILFEGNRVSWR
jgi:hypothetical protein